MINILRLTESDLHRIVEESVRRIISEETEYTEKDLERIKAELRKARVKKDVQSIIRLGREYNDAMIQLGKRKTVNNPEIGYSEKENAKRGITPVNGTAAWRVKGNMNNKNELNKIDRARLKLNPELGIV